MSRTNVGLPAIRDGLSQTAAISEKLRGDPGHGLFDQRADMVVSVLAWPSSPQAPPSACSELVDTDDVSFYDHGGYCWGLGGMETTAYNHVLPPNSRDADCVWRANPIAGTVAARSNHSGGVNLLMCDGSARFVKGSIDPSTWQAIGTRAGGEVVAP